MPSCMGGQVNLVYALVTPMPFGEVEVFGDIVNPEFCGIEEGFVSAERSGPRWYETYWAIGPDGRPFARFEQVGINATASRRIAFDENGDIVAQSLAMGRPRPYDLCGQPGR